MAPIREIRGSVRRDSRVPRTDPQEHPSITDRTASRGIRPKDRLEISSLMDQTDPMDSRIITVTGTQRPARAREAARASITVRRRETARTDVRTRVPANTRIRVPASIRETPRARAAKEAARASMATVLIRDRTAGLRVRITVLREPGRGALRR